MNSVEKPRVTLEEFKTAMADSITSGQVKQIEPPLEHYHAPGLYGRRIFVPGGTAVLTKVHKTEHITIALKGSCTVVDENGVKTEVVAPSVFITKPGTRRAVYAHDDVEWITVHATEEQDVEKLEATLVCDSQEEVDREDYKRVLVENNTNEKWARNLSENPRTWSDDMVGDTGYYIADSVIEGKGVFADKDYDVGDFIGVTRLGVMRTPMGRYTNHSINPNCVFRAEPNRIVAIAARTIYEGEEITVCYRLARKVNIEATKLLEKLS